MDFRCHQEKKAVQLPNVSSQGFVCPQVKIHSRGKYGILSSPYFHNSSLVALDWYRVISPTPCSAHCAR